MDLLSRADVLIEGMRPGAMERLGLGPESCHAKNPRLVYGRVTGWGQTGPLSRVAGHENNFTALAGALYYTGSHEEPPSSAVTLVGDVGGGALYLAVGILAGVLNARASGRGTVVDAAISDGSAHMMQMLLAMQSKGLVERERGKSFHDRSHLYSTYRCSDGNFVAIGAIEPKFYMEFLKKIGPCIASDDLEFSQWDRQRWPRFKGILQKIFSTRTRAEWCEILEGTEACFAPVLSPSEAAVHPHNLHRSIYQDIGGVQHVTPAPRFDGKVSKIGKIPQVGEHTAAIKSSLACAGGIDAVWKSLNGGELNS